MTTELCKECGAEVGHDENCLLVRTGQLEQEKPKRRFPKGLTRKKPAPKQEESDDISTPTGEVP